LTAAFPITNLSGDLFAGQDPRDAPLCIAWLLVDGAFHSLGDGI